MRIKVRKDWDREQAERDIQQQLSGARFEDRVKAKLEHYLERTPEHNQLIESLLSLPESTLKEEHRRRSTAINAIAAYCKVKEGVTRRAKRVASRLKQTEAVVNPLQVALEAAKVSVYRDKRSTICFVCLGKENSPIKERIYSFHTLEDLSKHFKKRHLAKIKGGEGVGCNLYYVRLDNKMHLQQHAYNIYRTVS